jgi:hypothetical protein
VINPRDLPIHQLTDEQLMAIAAGASPEPHEKPRSCFSLQRRRQCPRFCKIVIRAPSAADSISVAATRLR